MYEIPRPMRCKNREKNICQRKIITQDSIYMIWQFVYIHRIAEISLFSGKNTKCSSTIFLFKKRHQNLNLQSNRFYILRTGFTMDYKNGPKIFPGAITPKPPRRLVHERYPSLHSMDQASEKLPLKTVTTLFRVGS